MVTVSVEDGTMIFLGVSQLAIWKWKGGVCGSDARIACSGNWF